MQPPMKKRRLDDAHMDVKGSLGQGVYGHVLAVKVGGESMALKVLKTMSSPVEYQSMAREIFGLSQAGHLRGLVSGPKTANRVGLLMPQFGRRLGGGITPLFVPSDAAAILRPIAEGLAAFPGMHRDVKPSNLVLPTEPSQVAAFLDFSLATHQTESGEGSVVTMWYRAPEILLNLRYTNKIDVWSLGLVLFNMLTGAQLLRHLDESQAGYMLLDLFDHLGWPADWPEADASIEALFGRKMPKGSQTGLISFQHALSRQTQVAKEALDVAAHLLGRMLAVKPDQRADWAEVLDHPFWYLATAGPGKTSVSAVGALSADQTRDLVPFVQASTLFTEPSGGKGHTGQPFQRAAWPLSPGDNLRGALYDMHLLLDMCKAHKFSSDTAGYAHAVLRRARAHGLLQGERGLLVSLFLAASFNEDAMHVDTWEAWNKTFAGLEDSTWFASIVPAVIACLGQWPQVGSWSAFVAQFDVGGYQWARPYLMVLWSMESQSLAEVLGALCSMRNEGLLKP